MAASRILQRLRVSVRGMIMYDETIAIKTTTKEKVVHLSVIQRNEGISNVDTLLNESWAKIAPFWPLKNLIAVNPLQGLEDLAFEQALIEGGAYFTQQEMPLPMQEINIQTIKWLQAFFDQGQASITMPYRQHGLYTAWKKLAYFDNTLHNGDVSKRQWLLNLPNNPEQAVVECLLKLNIPKDTHLMFLTLMLTTLPGWAAHIKYRTDWTQTETYAYKISQAEYTAIRLIITCLVWQNASELIGWHKECLVTETKKINPAEQIKNAEKQYTASLLEKITAKATHSSNEPDAQLVFCIDVRSEPFRRSLENEGNYETFGFAGFFGIPVSIQNATTQESYASCPVLLQPKHAVQESPCSNDACIADQKGHAKLKKMKSLYQSLKYNFTTPFVLVEFLGVFTGFWMLLKTLFPTLALRSHKTITRAIRPDVTLTPDLDAIQFNDQCVYAESALRAIGLTKNFAPLVVFCGHGSTTQNNAYATALDCGACGGRHGASNARILAKILNSSNVRKYLAQKNIFVPLDTYFVAAEHNTTTDEVEIFLTGAEDANKIQQLKQSLNNAGITNRKIRAINLGASAVEKRSADWAQVRPEWGLARNAAFIVAPRSITKHIDLEGRAFLHSYEYETDVDGSILTLILTAPMVVAQWINSQYLFSTLDNVAYGAGSKITKNITGKIGIMQGNASDLMTGLPLQSVYKTDQEAYHQPVRLTTIVCAPSSFIDGIIAKQPVLQKLFRNGWVNLICFNPENIKEQYFLNRDLTWRPQLNV